MITNGYIFWSAETRAALVCFDNIMNYHIFIPFSPTIRG